MAKRWICQITYADGRETISYPVTPKIQINFEKFYHIPLGSLESSGEMTKAYQLAYEVQKAHKEDMPGGVMPTFEDWSDTLISIENSTEDFAPFGQEAPASG